MGIVTQKNPTRGTCPALLGLCWAVASCVQGGGSGGAWFVVEAGERGLTYMHISGFAGWDILLSPSGVEVRGMHGRAGGAVSWEVMSRVLERCMHMPASPFSGDPCGMLQPVRESDSWQHEEGQEAHHAVAGRSPP